MPHPTEAEPLEQLLGFDRSFARIREEATKLTVIRNPRPCELGELGRNCVGEYVETVARSVPVLWQKPYERASRRPSAYFIPREPYVESILMDVIDVLGATICRVLIERSKTSDKEGLRFSHLILALGYAFWGKYREKRLFDQLNIQPNIGELIASSQRNRMIEPTSQDQRQPRGETDSVVSSPLFQPTEEAIRRYAACFEKMNHAVHVFSRIVIDDARRSSDTTAVDMNTILLSCMRHLPEMLGESTNALFPRSGESDSPSTADVLVSLGFGFLQPIYQHHPVHVQAPVGA